MLSARCTYVNKHTEICGHAPGQPNGKHAQKNQARDFITMSGALKQTEICCRAPRTCFKANRVLLSRTQKAPRNLPDRKLKHRVLIPLEMLQSKPKCALTRTGMLESKPNYAFMFPDSPMVNVHREKQTTNMLPATRAVF
jgi:hypothetical protein